MNKTTMEAVSLRSRAPVLGTILALGLLAGCSAMAPEPEQAITREQPQTQATTSGPQLAGAWYQIYFDTNSAGINERGQMIVKNIARIVANVNDNGPTRVTVIGKTDRVGSPPANMALSRKRAEIVRDALVSEGVPADRIDTTWTGERRQQVATANDVTERLNRVVDVTVVKDAH